MAREAGRDSLLPMQRALLVLQELRAAGAAGVLSAELAERAGYNGTEESKKEMLKRDINNLRAGGWEVSNIAPAGAQGRYRLEPGDPRIRVALSDAAAAEFARVAQLAGVESVAVSLSVKATSPAVQLRADRPGYALTLVHHGLEHRCLLEFSYRDKQRRLIPDAVWRQGAQWYVRGRLVPEDWGYGGAVDDGVEGRTFRLDRISSLVVGSPGTAGPADTGATVGVDPLGFADGEPFDAVVEVEAIHRGRVERSLGRAREVERDGEVITLVIPVINRTTFVRRLYELGPRVRLVGPAEIREHVRDDLLAHVRRTP